VLFRSAELDGGEQQNVIEIYTADGESTTFYFGFQSVFKFDRNTRYLLHDCSISVFHDVLGERIPVFRAEWHRNDATSPTSTHIQPHWHFLQRPARIESVLLNTQRIKSGEIMEFVPEEKAALFSELADCGKSHFAMTSLWEKRSDTHRIFNSDEFLEWFDGLARHIADEISYVAKKMPSAAKDFQSE
jgi:hypothetical protein